MALQANTSSFSWVVESYARDTGKPREWFEAPTLAEVKQVAPGFPTGDNTSTRFYLKYENGRAYTMPGGLEEAFRTNQGKLVGIVPAQFHDECAKENRLVWKWQEIRTARQRLQMTQEQFGEAMGITGNSVARLERGETAVTKSRAQLVQLLTEQRLGVRWESLMAFEAARDWAEDFTSRVGWANVPDPTATSFRICANRVSDSLPGELWEMRVRPNPASVTENPSVIGYDEIWTSEHSNVLKPAEIVYPIGKLQEYVGEVVSRFAQKKAR